MSLEKNRIIESQLSVLKSENLALSQQLKEKNLLNDNLLNQSVTNTGKLIKLERLLTEKNKNEFYLNEKISILSQIKTSEYAKEVEDLKN